MIQRVFERARRRSLGQCLSQIVKPENAPARSPEKQIGLALDAVNIRKKSSHQCGGKQECQRNEILVH